MNVGTMAPLLAFLLLLLPNAAQSGDSALAASNGAESRNPQFMGDGLDVRDLAKILDGRASPSETSSPPDLPGLCMEIAGKVKEALPDQNLKCEIDNLAAALCPVLPSNFGAQLRTSEACEKCRTILDVLVNFMGDADKKLLLIVYLFKACEVQTILHDCKQYVFTFGPLLLSGLQMIVGQDICHMLNICPQPRNHAQPLLSASTNPEIGDSIDVRVCHRSGLFCSHLL